MMHKGNPHNTTPDWLRHALRVMQDAECGVRNIDFELRHAMALVDIDPRLISEMQNVRDALGTVKVSLSVMEMIADKVIDEPSGHESTGLKQAVAR